LFSDTILQNYTVINPPSCAAGYDSASYAKFFRPMGPRAAEIMGPRAADTMGPRAAETL